MTGIFTNQPDGALALDPASIGRLPGTFMHFETFAAFQAAVAAEVARVTAGHPLWPNGQRITVGSEPTTIYRTYDVGGGHARNVVIRPGLAGGLLADSNTVFESSGAPDNATGNDGDISIDWDSATVYTRTSGTWGMYFSGFWPKTRPVVSVMGFSANIDTDASTDIFVLSLDDNINLTIQNPYDGYVLTIHATQTGGGGKVVNIFPNVFNNNALTWNQYNGLQDYAQLEYVALANVFVVKAFIGALND